MLIDTFLYNGEEDILDLRYEVLKDKVDLFIGVEGRMTFTGIPKVISEVPAYDRLYWSIVSDFPEASERNAWKREMWQRNWILTALNGLNVDIGYGDTLVMVSDVDEIPNPDDIPEHLEPGELIRFQHEFYHFNFNNHVIKDDSAKKGWSCTALCRLDDLRKWYPQGVRNQLPAKIIYSGWHLSWFHDPENKLKSYSHQELNKIEGSIAEKIQQRWDYGYEDVVGLDHLPLPVQQNPERWSKYFGHPLVLHRP